MSFHVFGDSHANCTFKGLESRVCIHWLGPKTMYAIGRDGLNLKEHHGNHLKTGDVVGFVFGEIDVRCHIKKQENNPRLADQVIDELTTAFVNAIKINVNALNDIKFCVVSVLPPAYDALINSQDSAYAVVGTDKERCDYTIQINESLKSKIMKIGVTYIDTYSLYVDENGMLDPTMSRGTHVSGDTFRVKQLLLNCGHITK